MQDKNYIQVSGWMVTRLGLKGNSLLAFALIYGFSQDGASEFKGSIGYICEWLNCSRPTASKALDDLEKKGFISKRVESRNGVIFNSYKVTSLAVKNLYEGSKETLQGSKESLQGGSKETLYNNTNLDNTKDNNKDTHSKEEKKKGIDYLPIVNAYKETCVSLPSVRSLSESRKKAIRARLNSGYTIDDFTTLFEKAQASDFLTGRSGGSWTATFDWLLNEANMLKVLEGNYDNKRPTNQREIDKIPKKYRISELDYDEGWDDYGK